MRIVNWNEIPIFYRRWYRPNSQVQWQDTGELYPDIPYAPAMLDVTSYVSADQWSERIMLPGIYCLAYDGTDPNKCG